MSSFCNVCGTVRSSTAPHIRRDHTTFAREGNIDARVRELTAASESHQPAWFEPLTRKSGRKGSPPPAAANAPTHTHHEGTDVTWDIHHRDHNNLRFVSSLRRDGGAAVSGQRAESGSSDPRHRLSTSPVPLTAAVAAHGSSAGFLSHTHGGEDCRGVSSTSAYLMRLEDQIILLSDHTEWCRRGFVDLCHAVRDDFRTIREEVDARVHQLEQTVLIAVSDAVSREQRYRALVQQSDWMTSTSPSAASPQPPAAEQQQRGGSSSPMGVNEVALLRELGARIAALEGSVAVMDMRQQQQQQKRAAEHGVAAVSNVAQRNAGAAGSVSAESSTALSGGGSDEQLRSHAHHVHSLTAAHQQLMQTLLDERCNAMQNVFDSKLRTLEVQMADLRGRVNAQSSEHREAVYRLYRELSGDTATPPPQGNS